MNRPIPTHAGETWLTVSTTGPACYRTKVSVVVRRRFEPAVPIHVREEWKCSARIPLDVDEDALEPAPEFEADPPPEKWDETFPPMAAADVTCEMTGAVGAAVLTGGAATPGFGRLGRTGSGTGTRGDGTLTVPVGTGGIGGIGPGSAAADPARVPRLRQPGALRAPSYRNN